MLLQTIEFCTKTRPPSLTRSRPEFRSRPQVGPKLEVGPKRSIGNRTFPHQPAGHQLARVCQSSCGTPVHNWGLGTLIFTVWLEVSSGIHFAADFASCSHHFVALAPHCVRIPEALAGSKRLWISISEYELYVSLLSVIPYRKGLMVIRYGIYYRVLPND